MVDPSIEKITEDYYRLVNQNEDVIVAHIAFGKKHMMFSTPYAEGTSDTETIVNMLKDLGFNVE